ncbi:MAG: tetratricopeptide repeat protein, partial [Deltaproteobacteria bacterium]|nr:tetratricopeptide repeat protein [Deltaproteobacteria bacterium]
EGDLARRLVAHRGRGDTRFRIGRSEGSVDDFAEARRLSKSCGRTDAEIDILLDEATAWDWQNDHPRSQALVDEARALASRQQRLPLLVQARLSMGEGRALFRAGRWESACTSLEDAAEIAQNLGDPGYETLIACLTMLEVVLPMLGRIDDAQTVSERAVLLASERQDLLHLASALNNRRNLLIARRDVNAAVADQQRFMRIGRELGIVLSEYYGEYNLGELLSYAGRLDEADVHTQRAVELEATQPDVAARPVALLLRARLLAHRGQEAQALELAQKIRAQVAAGGTRAALAPSENVLLRAVELACVPSTPAQWAPLLAESERESIEQEPIEVLELMALSFARRGLAAEARAGFQKALAVAAKVPNILEPRVLKGLTALT